MSDAAAVARFLERRAARASLLAPTADAARAPLEFAAGLYGAQATFARSLDGHPLSGSLAADVGGMVPALRDLARWIAGAAPPALAATARARLKEERDVFCARLAGLWEGEVLSGEDYLSRALLKPYVETLAARDVRPDRPPREGACPFCAGGPWIAARRPAGDGEQRFLGCALCAREWVVNRIRCPVCEEVEPAKVPSFQSEASAYRAARIEACESCHHYVKSLDLTADARIIPEVDDLVSVAMDLWAVEQGYRRVEPGLAG